MPFIFAMKRFGMITLIISGAILICAGAFLLIRYYSFEHFCAISRALCPNYANFLSLGVPLLIIGVLLISALIIGLYGSFSSKKNAPAKLEPRPAQVSP